MGSIFKFYSKVLKVLLVNFVIFLLNINQLILSKKSKKALIFNEYSQIKHKFIVVYASHLKSLDSSSSSLLNKLSNDGAYIILLTNNADANSESFIGCVDVFIDNNSHGRDFGQFKSATNFIYSEFKGMLPEKIVYCNDSVIFLGSQCSDFIEILQKADCDFVGLFENPGNEIYKSRWFVSSWFFSVSREFFLSQLFQKFFINYKPLTHKNHAVRAGEIELSHVALKFSGRIHVEFDNERLIRLSKNFIEVHGVKKFLEFMPFAVKDDFSKQCSDSDVSDFIYFLETNLYKYSATHVFNLFLVETGKLSFLKKDLFWSGNVNYDQFSLLENILNKILPIEAVQHILQFYKLRGKQDDASIAKKINLSLGIE